MRFCYTEKIPWEERVWRGDCSSEGVVVRQAWVMNGSDAVHSRQQHPHVWSNDKLVQPGYDTSLGHGPSMDMGPVGALRVGKMHVQPGRGEDIGLARAEMGMRKTWILRIVKIWGGRKRGRVSGWVLCE